VRVAVLHDEPCASPRPDQQDTLDQAVAVGRHLEAAGHRAWWLPFGLDLPAARRRLEALAPDLVFNLVESLGGSGRRLHLAPALLEALGLPFTGADAGAMLATGHKPLAKRVLTGAALPTPGWVEAGGRRPGLRSSSVGGTAAALAGRRAQWGAGGQGPWRRARQTAARPGRWIVKPVWEDASIGLGDDAVLEVADPERLPELVEARAARLGGEAFAEEYVEGRELNLSLLAKGEDVEVLPPAEIVFEAFPPGKPRIVGYAAKWDPASFEYAHTPRRFEFPAEDRALLAELEELARRAWSLFGLSGYARVDFRVDEARRPWILELNANPCLSEDAGFAAAAARANLAPRAVVERIVAAALARHARASGR
jgi:D-alanine-D-alanine ligase